MSVSDISCFPESIGIEREIGEPVHNWNTTAKIVALKIASHLSEPICKVREYFYTFYILNETCRASAQKVMKAAFLTLGIALSAVLTPFTAPLGAAVRGIVAAVEAKPFIYLGEAGQGKALPLDRKITLVSHNQCYMPAGYSITDGQVTPSSDRARMNANIQKIKELAPDIVCLFEVPDICDACYISSQLPEYPFVIPVAGIRAVGPSSMMFIASKYEIAKDSIEFVPFAKGTELTGRARFSEKGFLSFDIKSRGERSSFATIVSTHLQHSEIPSQPTKGDKIARAAQMNKIARKIQAKIEQGAAVIFTGDLNQEEEELNAFLVANRISWLRRDPSVEGKATWGGDKWCADLAGKPASGSLVLDYSWIAGKATEISTRIIGVGFSGSEFKLEASSDHDLLFSAITVA